jgi:redox-sensitive bicupin YhaK (pirin superfamily)
MINLYAANSRFRVNHGWLQSNFSFSFADYYDPSNMNFGPLRVLNDDVVAPQTGFGMHPHRNMEIITIVLKGQLEHRDDLGNIEVMQPGIVQKMTAGRGIRHSETNPSETKSAEFLQLWLEPSVNQLDPGYEMITYSEEQLKNRLHPIISHKHLPGEGHINQDAILYLASLEVASPIEYPLGHERRGFLFVIDGTVQLNQEYVLQSRDSARISDEQALSLTATEEAKILFIDLP